ncbi:MAG: hypothetical protein K9J06_07900 [Flavobacteriales bacterium]|nr:hypothetical protein [Flavobacteriales bacterium]
MYTQQLGHIVSGLLRSNSMVILPGFGGLVLERIPAQLDAQRGRLLPPSDTLIFNARLHHNDGMVVEAVAEQWGFPLNEADNWLTDAITELRFALNGGGTVEWPGLGTFKLSYEGRVHFVAAKDRDSATDMFGLRPLQLAEVQRSTDLRERTLDAARALPVKRIIGYAAAAMAVGLLAWLPFQQGVMNGGKQLVAQMGLMNLHSETSYSPRGFRPLWEPSPHTIPVAASLEAPVLEGNESEPIALEETAVVFPTRFHVVAAVFATGSEAEAYRSKLVSRGFGAELVGTDPQGRHAVAYGTYEGMGLAESMLASVRLSNSGAHILPAN